MSGYLNKATLIGNLGRDPEARSLSSGKSVVTLSVATSESWRDANSGERRERTEWHRVVIWNEGLGKIAEQYLTKGAKVYVEGKLVTNRYTDKDGVERFSTEIHLTPFNGTLTFLDSKRDDAKAPGGPGRSDPPAREAATAANRSPSWAPVTGSDLDDEIPF